MIAAIEKMKELKAGYSSKLEEVNTANSRISELEETLSRASHEVLKYRGAMEKAMPKFKELKSELDTRTMEKNAACEENAALTQKLQEMCEKLQKNSDADDNLIDVSDYADLSNPTAKVIPTPQPIHTLTSTVDSFPGLATSLLPMHVNTVQNLLDVDFVQTQEESTITTNAQMKNIDLETIASLTDLVAQLKASKEEITANAALTESNLRNEIEALTQVD